MKKQTFWGCFSAIAVLGMSLVVCRENLIPERFDGDAQSIAVAAEMVAEDPEAEYIDRYYTNAGRVYGALQVADKPMVVGIVGYLSVVGLVVVVFWRWKGNSKAETYGALGISVVVLGLSAVYLGTLSKDIFGVLLVAAPLILGGRQKWGLPASLGGAVVFGLIFRTYYVVVALLAGLYWLVWKYMRPTLWQWAIIVTLMVILGVTAYYVLTGNDISLVREMNNAGREATSMIPNLTEPGSLLGGIVNSLVAGLLMILPLPLFMAGGAYHVLSGLLMMGIAGLVIWMMRDNNFRGKASTGLVLILSLFTVQCLFEPDLGSVLRHWTMLGTVFVFIYCSARGKYARA